MNTYMKHNAIRRCW